MASASETLVIGSSPLIAIVRFHDGGDLRGTIDALTRGGVAMLELTIDTPGALEAVAEAADAGHTVGVGTVLTADQVVRSADAGARFVVSPGLVPEVVEAAHERGIEPMPGVLTPTELIHALATGARVLKVFPASFGGPGVVRALRGPFPDVPLVPTGGVRIDEISAYLEAGATAVGVGSDLVGRSAPTSDRELEWIAAQATRAVAAAGAWVASDGAGRPGSSARPASEEP